MPGQQEVQRPFAPGSKRKHVETESPQENEGDEGSKRARARRTDRTAVRDPFDSHEHMFQFVNIHYSRTTSYVNTILVMDRLRVQTSRLRMLFGATRTSL